MAMGEACDGGSTRRGVVLDAVALQHYMKDLMQGLFGDMLVWKISQRDLRSQPEPSPVPAPPAQSRRSSSGQQ